ncbi:S9 family peptidase [Periophthalmus magnuspinnatus]|uniref:S9 family peptidase n=1 Tax=Periophthalmus magnuspinnatus TaxID=409849 RepID=UPI00145B2ACA|nr:S9 family peptidase [Periophthalmus magnuspinnatus]
MDPARITGLYSDLCALAVPVRAHVKEQKLNGQTLYDVNTEWTQNELVRGSRLRFCQRWTLVIEEKQNIQSVLPPGPAVPLNAECLSSFSPVQGLRAVIKDTSGHQILEVWDERGLRKCLNLTALNKHGRIYDDAYFSCLSWSRCENKLLYIAEKKTESPNASSGDVKDRSVYREDWGEALSQKSSPVLCCVDLRTGTHSVLQGAPDQVSPGQALWSLDGESVFFVGWFHEPYRLGLNFCTNRRSALFRIDLEGNCERLSEENVSVLSPRLSPDGSALAFLQGKMFGPHAQCLKMQLLDLKSKKISTLIDVVHRVQNGEDTGGFAGVYESLPSCCWSEDSQRIVFSSAHKNWKDIFVVDRQNKSVSCLSDNVCDGLRVFGSWRLLTIHRNLMVVCCSSPNTPPTLRVGFLPSGGHSVSWKTLQPPLCTFDFSWTVMDVRPSAEEDNAKYTGLDFGAILVKLPTQSKTKLPLAVFIHGGPHSQFPAEWNITTAALVQLGLAVLMVNYRGSTGFGQDSILSLIGQIGQQDVKDVQRAVQFALQTDTTLDPERLAVFGGSHGGFLSCHLIGQFPDVYRACAVRNPVVNAATLLGTSDIIDWRYSSVGMHFSYEQIPTAEALATMLERSPITHAAKMKCALLLMLGGRDRRVSPHQGLELYRALKSRGRTVRLLWFPEDGHSLSRVDTQTDCFLNMVLWLQQHL